MSEWMEFTGFEIEQLLVDGDGAAALVRAKGILRETGREFHLLIADFARFRDGKVVEFCALYDGLRAVEQLLGHPLDLAGLWTGRHQNAPTLAPS